MTPCITNCTFLACSFTVEGEIFMELILIGFIFGFFAGLAIFYKHGASS